jgi:hypothetical protein
LGADADGDDGFAEHKDGDESVPFDEVVRFDDEAPDAPEQGREDEEEQDGGGPAQPGEGLGKVGGDEDEHSRTGVEGHGADDGDSGRCPVGGQEEQAVDGDGGQVGEREGKAVGVEGEGQVEAHDEERHHGQDQQEPDDGCVGADGVGEPAEAEEHPPHHGQGQQGVQEALPAGMGLDVVGDLCDHEDEDEVEEQLDRRHPAGCRSGTQSAWARCVRAHQWWSLVLGDRCPGRAECAQLRGGNLARVIVAHTWRLCLEHRPREKGEGSRPTGFTGGGDVPDAWSGVYTDDGLGLQVFADAEAGPLTAVAGLLVAAP